MRIINLLLIALTMISCSSDDSQYNNNSKSLKKLILTTNDQYHSKSIYEFDNTGNVVKQINTNDLNSSITNVIFYTYNSQGKIWKKFVNGVMMNYVNWDGNCATLYTNNNQIQSKFFYNPSGKLYKVLYYCIGSNSFSQLDFEYDNNDNLVKFYQNGIPYFEFFDYHPSKINPYYLLRSIEILNGLEMETTQKKVAFLEREFPHYDEDGLFMGADYNHIYTFDSEDRVSSKKNMRTYFLTNFEYIIE